MNTSKQINAMIVLLLTLLVGVGFYTLWDPFRAEDEHERTREVIAVRAGHTYASNCRVCHGDEGEGRIGPALNPEARRASGLEDWTDPNKRTEYANLVQNTLVCGRIGKIMPPWSQAQGGALNDEQIRQLVILITENPGGNAWEKVGELGAEANHVATVQAVEDVLKGASITGSAAAVCGQKISATPTPTPTPPAVATNWTVVGTDNKFDVNAIAVPAGRAATIEFQNKGAAIHNIHVQKLTDSAGKEPQTPLSPGGTTQTVTFTATATGAYDYICDVHPQDMRGILFVQ